MTESYQTIEVRPTSGALGAEIHGIDLSTDIGDDQLAELRRAFDDFGVIFFRDQVLTPERHIAFAERWGRINVNRFFQPVAGYPRIAEVRKEPENQRNVGGLWHTDHSYDQVPALGSILYAREVPETGGDTLFASMARAFEALSEGLKQTLRGLNALHSSRHVFGAAARTASQDEDRGRLGNQELATQDAVHPVILRHPRTGREGIYVNPDFTVGIEGWREDESKPFLDMLYRHTQKPEFTCRFRWREGSIAFWDNLATWHRALNDYPGQRRLMHRITLDGVPLN
jgi:taurine dioxygenase